MILRRLGNKSKLAKPIQAYFPIHEIYVSPFFGAGGMFFNKPKSKFNIVNDLSSDVFNLFMVVMNQKDELVKAFTLMPIHADLLKYWRNNEETAPIKKALRFLFLSNFTFMSKGGTMGFQFGNSKDAFYKGIDKVFNLLDNVKFNNCDFRKFLKDIAIPKLDFGKPSTQKDKVFIYSDSPYLESVDTYKDSDTWTKTDVVDLLDALEAKGCKFAYSEFNHPFILEQAKERSLNVITIGERKALSGRKVEILLTNYPQQKDLFNQ